MAPPRCQKCRSSMQKSKPWSLPRGTKGLPTTPAQLRASLHEMRPQDEGATSHTHPNPTPRASFPSGASFSPLLDHQPRVLGSTKQKDNGDRARQTQIPAEPKPSWGCGMPGFGPGPSVPSSDKWHNPPPAVIFKKIIKKSSTPTALPALP